jgi:hypothetical protein
MGEASNKINHDGAGHKRVQELREEIVRKRDTITMELDELRRRRADAIVRAKEGAKLAAGGAVGVFIVSSLVGAFRDLLRGEDDEPELVLVEKEEERGGISSTIISVLTSVIIGELRNLAMNYAREQLREKLNSGERKAA